MIQRRPRWPRILVFAVALFLTLVLTRNVWLRWLGEALVHNDPPARADLAVVLAGDQWCNRVMKGGDLVRQVYVPAALVSGPPVYGVPESQLTIGYAVRQGDPPQWFIPFPNSSLSTRQEAEEVLAELRRRHVHSFLLVTSDYHTGRASRIYRSLLRHSGDGMEVRVIAAPDKYFHPDSWWKIREGQKIWFMEWTKTFATAVGM